MPERAPRATPVRHALSHPAARIAMLGIAAAAAIALFLLLDLPGRADYALGLRWRTVTGMLVVAIAVGASTVLLQTVTANRILTPGIMGFDAIFMTIQVTGVLVIGPRLLLGTSPTVLWGIELVLMAGIVVLLYWWLFIKRRLDLHLIVLVGLVIGTMLRAVTTFLQRLLDPDAFAVVQNLVFASFTAIDRDLLLPTGVLVVAAGVSIVPILRSLDALALGRSTAIGLGVAHRRVVMHAVVAIAVMVAASTALVGPVLFFGLLVANAAYSLVGHRHAASIPAAALIGAIVLIGGQTVLARGLGFATELPVVIEFLGGALFILLVLTGRTR